MSPEVIAAIIGLVASPTSALLVALFAWTKVRAETEKIKLETEVIRKQLTGLNPELNKKIIIDQKGLVSYFFFDECEAALTERYIRRQQGSSHRRRTKSLCSGHLPGTVVRVKISVVRNGRTFARSIFPP